MNSLERVQAMLNGKPFDKYPVICPHPYWYMQPHWPQINGKCFLHPSHGSDEEKIECWNDTKKSLGIDFTYALITEPKQDTKWKIEFDGKLPVLINLKTGERESFPEIPKDLVDHKQFNTLAEIEALPAPQTADEIYKPEHYELQKRVIAEQENTSFLYTNIEGPFSACYRALTFEGLYETMIDSPAMIHAMMERYTETAIQTIKAIGRSGIIHGLHSNEFPGGADLISEAHFKEFILPYMKQYYRVIKEEGLVSIMEFLNWTEPRLNLLADLDLDILQTESSLKGYQNRLTEYRRILGDDICLFSNTPIYEVIEKGDKNSWLTDAGIQAQGIGSKKKFGICPGRPLTWATTPERFKKWHETVQDVYQKIAPTN